MSSSSFILKAGAVLSALSSTTLAHYAPPAYGYKSSSTPVAYGHGYPSSKPAGYEHGHKTSTPCTTSTPAAYGYPSSSPAAYAYSSPAADYASEYAPEYSSATDDYASEYAPEYTPSSSADYASEYSPEYTTTEKKYPTKTPVNYGTTSTPCSTETPVYVSYDTTSTPCSTETPVYVSYDTTSTPCSTETPVYYDASSVPSYEVKSSYVPYEHYEHSAPSYEPSTPVAYEPYTTSKPKIYSHIITATYTRTYVDICSTGYTTKTTTQTVEYCPETTQTYATAPPPGLTITTKVCTACAATPVTVTLTLPCETTSTYVKPTPPVYSMAPPPSETPLSYTYCKTCTNLTPTYTHEHVHKTYPVAPTPYVDDSTSTIYQSKISTVYVAPSPAPPSYETSPAPAPPSYETSLVPPPCVGEGCTATLPVPPKPYPTPATNVYQNDYMTLSYGTGTASAYVPSKTYASDMPYFTGGAGAVRVGGAVVGGVVAAVAMVL